MSPGTFLLHEHVEAAVAGVWVDEFRAMGLDDCLDHVWERAEVFLDSGPTGCK